MSESLANKSILANLNIMGPATISSENFRAAKIKPEVGHFPPVPGRYLALDEGVPIVTLKADQIVTSSRDLADFFGKEHKNVFADIRELVSALTAEYAVVSATWKASVSTGKRSPSWSAH